MPRVLLIDGGQSHCRAACDGAITSLPGLSRAGRRYDGLRALVAERRPDVVAAGLTGYTGETLDWPAPRVLVTNDAVTAYLGALGDEPGAVIVAGTGAIALASDGEHWARADGDGTLLGDHGGGYWIGRRALALALRGDAPDLRRRAHARYGDDLIHAIYDASDPTAAIAAFTPDVADAARDGDDVAAAIWADAGRELARTVTDALAALRHGGHTGGAETRSRRWGPSPAPGGRTIPRHEHWDAAPTPVVSWSGGVFGAGDLILAPFRQALGLEVRAPLGDALAGAARLAAGTERFASLVHRSPE